MPKKPSIASEIIKANRKADAAEMALLQQVAMAERVAARREGLITPAEAALDESDGETDGFTVFTVTP